MFLTKVEQKKIVSFKQMKTTKIHLGNLHFRFFYKSSILLILNYLFIHINIK